MNSKTQRAYRKLIDAIAIETKSLSRLDYRDLLTELAKYVQSQMDDDVAEECREDEE